MNVSIRQSYHESDIKRQLRQRRAALDNQQVQTIKPFMSHRKPKFEDRQRTQCMSNTKDKQNIPLVFHKGKRQLPWQNGTLNTQKVASNMLSELSDDCETQKMEAPLKSSKKSLIVRNIAQNMLATKRNEPQLFLMQKPEATLKLSLKAKRKQVESIIFDSKVTKFQSFTSKQIESTANITGSLKGSHLFQFQLKANKVNEEIQEGLTKVQELIKLLKQKKQQKSQIKSQIKSQGRGTFLVQNLQKEFAERRALLKVEQPNDKNALIQQRGQKESSINPGESQIQLQGDFKNKKELFPPQYVAFISRITRQIEKDIEFTVRINELTKANQITEIKDIIFAELDRNQPNEVYFDDSFFRIQPSELDPLDQSVCVASKKPSRQQMETQALKIFRQYKDIQTHYNTKLLKNIQASTIQLLFQELSQSNAITPSATNNRSVTIGQLLSYLNMRTNKSFRNRSFVKMLKRLNLKSNGLITMQTLKPLIKC